MHSILWKAQYLFNLNWLLVEQPIYHLVFSKPNLRLELRSLVGYMCMIICKKFVFKLKLLLKTKYTFWLFIFLLVWPEENVKWRILLSIGGAAVWFIELIIFLLYLFELKLFCCLFSHMVFKVITFLVLGDSESTSLIEVTVLEFVLVIKYSFDYFPTNWM